MPQVNVGVYMDWQNVYRAAREAFDLHQAPPERGNFDPLAVARYLAAGNKRGRHGNLVRVEIHRGLPDSNTNPKGHGAAQRQKSAWEALAPEIIDVRLRPVRLNPETGEEEEKGIDVALACRAVEHVLLRRCDVAIIFSHDSDLLPPVEAICRLHDARITAGTVETASWKSDFYPYRIPPAKTDWGTLWGVVNHSLRVELFDDVEMPVNYANEPP